MNDYLERATQARKRIIDKQGILTERETRELLQTDEVRRIVRLFEPAFNRLNSYRVRLRAFLEAEDELGRQLKLPLDLLTYFSPAVKSARDFVRRRILPLL
jgi:hypothetical protein